MEKNKGIEKNCLEEGCYIYTQKSNTCIGFLEDLNIFKK